MAELTHDAEDGFHEIQLSQKQLVFLFMLTTVLCVVIFLCGILVGRGVRAARGGEDPPIATAASTPMGSVEAAPVQAAEPPAPPAQDELTYPQRLSGKSQAEEIQKTPEPPPPPAAAAPPVAEVPLATPAASAEPAGARSPAAADATAGPRPGAWVIQVHALQNRQAANAFVRSLTSKGYPAFLLSPSPGSPQIYRVQIGAYTDRGEAEKVLHRLEKEEQFKPAIKRR